MAADNPLNSDQFEIVHRTPLSYFISHQISLGDVRSVQQLKRIVSSNNESLTETDSILASLEESNLIKVSDDKITVLQRLWNHKLSGSDETNLIPSLFEIASRRALVEVESSNEEDIAAVATSDDPQIRDEIHTLVQDFRAKLRAIGKKAENRNSHGTRFVGIVNTKMVGADYSSSALGPYNSLKNVWRYKKTRQICHDLRPVLTSLQLLQRSHKLHGDAQNLLLSTISRARDLVEEAISDYAPLEGGTEIASLLDSFCAEKNQIYRGSVSVETSIRVHESTTVAVSSRQLRKALETLFENSISSSANRIRIACFGDGRKISIEIVDNGSGIDPEIAKRATLGNAITTKTTGNGIGLQQVREIAKAAGGSFEIKPGESEGTVVNVELPTS